MWLFREGMGWAATSLSAGSYFCKGSRRLRLVQASASLGWVVYGVLIHSFPVIGANILVASLAVYSALGPESGSTGRGSQEVARASFDRNIHHGVVGMSSEEPAKVMRDMVKEPSEFG